MVWYEGDKCDELLMYWNRCFEWMWGVNDGEKVFVFMKGVNRRNREIVDEVEG